MDEELDVKEPNMKIQGKIIELGSCVICGQPVKVAAAVHKIYDKTNTCSRECGELLNRLNKEGEANGGTIAI